MTLADDVDLEEYIMAKDDLSGADIKVTSNKCLTFCIHLSNLIPEFSGTYNPYTLINFN